MLFEKYLQSRLEQVSAIFSVKNRRNEKKKDLSEQKVCMSVIWVMLGI